MSDENPTQCPVCEGPMENWSHVAGPIWQTIETAPKDGTRVICWNREWQAPESGCLYGMFWAANSLAADKGGWKYQPTHWQPLPEPPSELPHTE